MTIIVTGAYGFIGSNIVHALNERAETNILAVDDLSENVQKFKNLNNAIISDYMDKTDFLNKIESSTLELKQPIRVIFHQGACSDTMNHDGAFMMRTNYEYTKSLFHFAQKYQIPFIYASSAATYGNSTQFSESPENEGPLNIYGYSKLLFDRYLDNYRNQYSLTAPVFGLRYFNVYGSYETHKARMASVAFHHFNQFEQNKFVNLFSAYDGYAAGEQKRDFVYVKDIVNVNLWLWDFARTSSKQAIEQSDYLNVGTGNAQSFNELACATVNSLLSNNMSQPLQTLVDQGFIRYIEFPEALKGKYQSFTQADITKLRSLGYDAPFMTVQEGVKDYIEWLRS